MKGGFVMRTKKKNTMRSPEEKEAIVLEYLNGRSRSTRKTAEIKKVHVKKNATKDS